MEKSIIMESVELEKPSKTTNSMFTTNPHPQVPHLHVFEDF